MLVERRRDIEEPLHRVQAGAGLDGAGVVVERVGIFAQELADAVRPKVEGRVATQEGHGRRQGRACVGGEPFGQHAGRCPSLDVARQEGSEQRSAIGIGPGEKRRRTDGTAIDLPFEQSQPVFTTEAGEARQVAVDFAAGPHARQLAHQWLVVHRKRRNADDELQLVGRLVAEAAPLLLPKRSHGSGTPHVLGQHGSAMSLWRSSKLEQRGEARLLGGRVAQREPDDDRLQGLDDLGDARRDRGADDVVGDRPLECQAEGLRGLRDQSLEHRRQVLHHEAEQRLVLRG